MLVKKFESSKDLAKERIKFAAYGPKNIASKLLSSQRLWLKDTRLV